MSRSLRKKQHNIKTQFDRTGTTDNRAFSFHLKPDNFGWALDILAQPYLSTISPITATSFLKWNYSEKTKPVNFKWAISGPLKLIF